MRISAPRRVVGGLAAMALCLAGTVACGSSSGGDTSGKLDSSQVTAAKAAVDKAHGPVEFIAPGDPFDVSKLRGKKIYFVTMSSVPFIERAFDSMKEAAKPLGIDLKMVSANGQTSAVADGIEQAIANGASAILVGNVDFKFIPEAVKAAEKAKVPLVGLLNISTGSPLPAGSSGEVSLDYKESGELLVAWAVAHAKKPFEGLYVNIPAVATFDAMNKGINEGFDKYCSACKVSTINVQEPNLKQQMESKTQAELRRNPKITWVFPAIDVLAQFGVPAIQALGNKDVQIGSINAVDANLGFIQNGTVQSVDVGNNNSWMGYAALDRLMRAMAGESPATSVVPIRLFDAENLKGQDVKDEDKLFDVDYRAEYRKLWLGQ